MLQRKKFFKAFWFIFKILGLQPHNLSQIELARGLFLFVSFACIDFALMATMVNEKNIISALQTFPGLSIMVVDMFVFAWKSREIEAFFINLCRIIDESGDDKLFTKYYRKGLNINLGLGAFAFISVTGGIIAFLLTGKSIMPIWMPCDRGPWFFVVWAIHSSSIIYQVLQLWLVEAFIIILLSILNAYSISLRTTIQKSSMEKRDVMKCVEEYLQFKS